MTDISIKDQNNDHKYFSILQNILSRIGLSAFERSVYWAIKECAGESGCCTKSYAKLAEMAGLSIPSLKRTLASLQKDNKILKKPLISINNRMTEYGDRDTNEIVLIDIWNDNNKAFSKKNRSDHTEPTSDHTDLRVGSHRTKGQLTQSYNKEPMNKNQYKEQQQAAVAVAVFFECLKKDKRLNDDNRTALMRFPESRIQMAIEYSHQVAYKTSLIQQLMWHCSCAEPPTVPKRNFWDVVKETFQNNHVYHGATCYIDEQGIALERGMTHLAVKFAEPGSKRKFCDNLRQMGIKWDGEHEFA